MRESPRDCRLLSPLLTCSSEVKRNADGAVDWSKVAYDLKDVDWDKVDWKSVFASPTPAASAPAAYTPEVKKPEPTPEAQKPAPAATTPAAAAPSVKVQSANTDNKSTGTVDVKAIADKIGVLTGKNDQSNNGGIWIGSDSAWTADFINDANEDSVIYCWVSSGYSGMSIKSVQPAVSYGLKAGQKVTLSFAQNVPAACAPAFADTALSIFAGLKQTWWEVTFGPSGAFDVSRNVFMKGRNISSKGSKCTSDMNTCVFKCQDSNADSCEKGYDLYGMSGGCGGGYDVAMAGTGGGCSMGSSGEKVTVTYS